MVAVSTTMVRQVAMSAIRGATTFVITCCYVIQKGFQNHRHNSFANRPIRKNQQESSTRGRSLTCFRSTRHFRSTVTHLLRRFELH